MLSEDIVKVRQLTAEAVRSVTERRRHVDGGHTSNVSSTSSVLDIRMTNQSQLLSELQVGPNWDRIHVRLFRMWNSISKAAKEIYSINLHLLDVKGNQKHAVVPKSLVDKYSQTFEEQCLYEIDKFNVYPAQNTYRPIDEELMIILRTDTKVKQLPTTMYDIPRYKFGFVDNETLAQRIDKVAQLTDVGGVLQGISDVVQLTTRTGCQTSKREITVHSGSLKNTSITLWADKTDLIDVTATESEKQPPSVIFTSMVVKLFKGEFTFSSTNATQIYLSTDYPEVAKLLPGVTDSEGSTVTTIDRQRPTSSTTCDQEIKSSIANMLDDIRPNDCHSKKYVVNATLMRINTSSGWNYLSCPSCRKTVTKETTGFSCSKCNTNITLPLNRYRISMEVFDHTGTANVTAFDKDAAYLLKRSVDEMMDISKTTNGDKLIDKLFIGLMGTEARFEFRPSTYDIMNNGKSLTVSRVSHIHHPYNPLPDRPDTVEPKDTKEGDGTQLTAESSSVATIGVTNREKIKVKQETEECLPDGSITEHTVGRENEPDRHKLPDGRHRKRGRLAGSKRKK